MPSRLGLARSRTSRRHFLLPAEPASRHPRSLRRPWGEKRISRRPDSTPAVQGPMSVVGALDWLLTLPLQRFPVADPTMLIAHVLPCCCARKGAGRRGHCARTQEGCPRGPGKRWARTGLEPAFLGLSAALPHSPPSVLPLDDRRVRERWPPAFPRCPESSDTPVSPDERGQVPRRRPCSSISGVSQKRVPRPARGPTGGGDDVGSSTAKAFWEGNAKVCPATHMAAVLPQLETCCQRGMPRGASEP